MSQFPSSHSAAGATSTAKTTGSIAGASTSGSVTKRLRSELTGLMMSGIPGISAFPESDSNINEWVGTIKGPDATPYEGFTYRITLSFPPQYPYCPPTIKFSPQTPIFHPNVALPGGEICLDILKEKWSAVLTVQTILVSLQSLLGEPNNDSPLNVEAADLWDNKEAFRAQVQALSKTL